MPSLKRSARSNPPLIRILAVALIGCAIGFIYNQYSTLASNRLIKGRICLVIDDFGFAFNETVKGFFKLDKNITAAIIPGTSYGEAIGDYADSLGIETIVHMPMETYEEDPPIPSDFILHDRLNAVEVEKRIKKAFEEITTAAGMSNHQGSKATESLQLMKDVARTLKKLEKYFLDSFTNPESRGFITMRRYGVKTELRQVFLDHLESPGHIQRQLDSLALLSQDMDVAIGIGHVKPTTLQVLKTEIPRLQSEGYQFIRLSQAVR